MEGKETFILRMDYKDVFDDMSASQAGTLIKAIFNFVAEGKEPEGLKDVEVKTAFKFIKKDLMRNAQKYAEQCQRNKENAKKGGRPKTEKTERFSEKRSVSEKTSGFFQNPNDCDSDVVSDSDTDKKQLLTAASAADQAEKSSKPRKLNGLQIFSNRVIEEFEDLKTDDQKAIWFKRNCRCLSDILKFCGGDIDVAVECIAVCVERLEKAGLTGGYEAVCRNITLYYDEALKRVTEWRITKNEK